MSFPGNQLQVLSSQLRENSVLQETHSGTVYYGHPDFFHQILSIISSGWQRRLHLSRCVRTLQRRKVVYFRNVIDETSPTSMGNKGVRRIRVDI